MCIYIYIAGGFQGIEILSGCPGMRFCSQSTLKWRIQLVQNDGNFYEMNSFCSRSNEIWPYSVSTVGCMHCRCLEKSASLANEDS